MNFKRKIQTFSLNSFFSWSIRVFLEAIENTKQNKTLTPTVIIGICWVFVFFFVVYTNVEPPFFILLWNLSKLFSNFIYFFKFYTFQLPHCVPFTQFSYSRIFESFFYITIFLERNKLSISPSAHIKNNFHNLIMHNKLRQKENNSGRNVQNAIYEVYIRRCYIRLYCNCM